MNIQRILTTEYMHNSVQDYIVALAIIILGITATRLFKRYLLIRLKHWASLSETNFDDVIVSGVDRFVLPILSYLVIYWGARAL